MSIKHVAIVCGGPSAEHEVSLRSALNIANAMDTSKYHLLLLGIDKQGQWLQFSDTQQLAECANKGKLSDNLTPVVLLPQGANSVLMQLNQASKTQKIDILFPIIHGPFGEDGAIQGLAKFCNIPCVGPSILGSAICMDKDVIKNILRCHDIKVSPSVTVYKHQQNQIDCNDIIRQFGLPLYVKPCNMGSSVGVSKVQQQEQLHDALQLAFQYDQKVLIEKQIVGRELEVALLGNQSVTASSIGEVIVGEQFYSYQSKYLNDQDARTQIPAQLSIQDRQTIVEVALKSYQAAQLSGLSRVDVFFTANKQVIVNEINTLPGFTDISMYPQLWQHAGLPPTQLMDRLIELAEEQFRTSKVALNN